MTDRKTQAVAEFRGPRLPYYTQVGEKFGVDQSSWRALTDAVWPAAKTVEGVLLALSYCKARNLDPFKRPVHVVPIWSTSAGGYVESVWPGIGELRTTAMRTGQFAGCDEAVFGADMRQTFEGQVKKGRDRVEAVKLAVTFPEWCRFTVYRLMPNGQRVAVPGPKVYWLETYARQGRSEVPNEMWAKRPRGQLEKCAEAAALRRAFPEEIGNEITAEEASGQSFEAVGPGGDVILENEEELPAKPKPSDFTRAGDRSPRQATPKPAEPAAAAEPVQSAEPVQGADAQAEAETAAGASEADGAEPSGGILDEHGNPPETGPTDDQATDGGEAPPGDADFDVWVSLENGWREAFALCKSLDELAAQEKEWREWLASPKAPVAPEDYAQRVSNALVGRKLELTPRRKK